MIRVVIVFSWLISCLESEPKHDSDLRSTRGGDIYVKTVFEDFGVRKDITAGFDTKYPTALHYLSYQTRSLDAAVMLGGEEYKDTGEELFLGNMLLSYQKDKITYTCRLEDVPYSSEKAIAEGARCFNNEDQDAYLFASMCIVHGKFVFHKSNSKDFSCDLSKADCTEDNCRIQINAGCVVKGDSSGGQCTAVKELWDQHKQSDKGIDFVNAVRGDYTSCSYASSALNCTILTTAE